MPRRRGAGAWLLKMVGGVCVRPGLFRNAAAGAVLPRQQPLQRRGGEDPWAGGAGWRLNLAPAPRTMRAIA